MKPPSGMISEDKPVVAKPGGAPPGPDQAGGRRRQRIDLPVRGMSCAGCAANIQKNLSQIKGVESASVNFAAATATVIFDPGIASPADFSSRIREIGYDVGTATAEIPIEGSSVPPASRG